MNNSYIQKSIILAIIALVLGLGGGYWIQDAKMKARGADDMNMKQFNLFTDMRELWAQHVFWTHEYIVAFAADLPESTEAANRLLKNQEDIGNAIKPYYGEEAGNQLTMLLKEHITIAVDLLNAGKANDEERMDAAEKRWKENAEQIATFLNAANPEWDKEEVNNMLDEHLTLTHEGAMAQLDGKWKESIDTFDKIFSQAMRMADGFSQGIAKQFPEKF